MKTGGGTTRLILLISALCSLVCVSCGGSGVSPQSGDLLITIEPGDEWMHEFSRMITNPPQFAVWIEDETGDYIQTVFVTRKAATEGWVFNKGNRRIEALPRWMHRRNIIDSAGCLLPSRKEPLVDGLSGATPSKRIEILFRPHSSLNRFRMVLEINHSTDFNSAWPENAAEGNANWSGGPEGSGQPSLVYSVLVDLSGPGPWLLLLDGHGSPDGSDGEIHPDVSSVTTALSILGQAQLERLP